MRKMVRAHVLNKGQSLLCRLSQLKSFNFKRGLISIYGCLAEIVEHFAQRLRQVEN